MICSKKLTSKFIKVKFSKAAQAVGEGEGERGRVKGQFYCFVEVAAKANENETENEWKKGVRYNTFSSLHCVTIYVPTRGSCWVKWGKKRGKGSRGEALIGWAEIETQIETETETYCGYFC